MHLHRRHEPRAVEIDAFAFEFGFAVTGSARLELDAWVGGGRAGRDRATTASAAFRPRWGRRSRSRGGRSPPPSRSASPREAGEAGATRRPVVLDNVEQFRFYSGWRAAVERRR